MAFDKTYSVSVLPEFSIILNTFQRENQIQNVLIQILKLTRGNYEILISNDGSSDSTSNKLLEIINEFESWPVNCSSVDIDEHEILPDIRFARSEQIGRRCFFDNPLKYLSRIRLINIAPPGLFEAKSNNILMRLSQTTKFHVIMQDDMFMTKIGWNLFLVMPFRLYSDAFSVSMRCAHDWSTLYSNSVGNKCSNPRSGVVKDEKFGYYVRDTANRGPLMLRASYVREIGFMDETDDFLAGAKSQNSDHELNYRAYTKKAYVSGYVPVSWTSDSDMPGISLSGSTDKDETLKQRMVSWIDTRRTKKATLGFPNPNTHSEFRPLPNTQETKKIKGVYVFLMIRETRPERVDQLLRLMYQLVTMTPTVYPSVIYTHDLETCQSWKVQGMEIACILGVRNFDYTPRRHFPKLFVLPSVPNQDGFNVGYRQMSRFAGGFLFSNQHLRENYDYAIKIDSDLRITMKWETDPFKVMSEKRAKMGYWMAYNDIDDVSVGLDTFFREYAQSHDKPLSNKLFVGDPPKYNNMNFYGCLVGVELEFVNSKNYQDLFEQYDATDGWFTGRWDEQKLYAFYGTHWAKPEELVCFDFLKAEHQTLTTPVCLHTK